LHLDAAIEEARQVPLAAAKDSLCVLASAGLMAAGQIAVAQAEEEEEIAKESKSQDRIPIVLRPDPKTTRHGEFRFTNRGSHVSPVRGT
jgi:hypothetical protein